MNFYTIGRIYTPFKAIKGIPIQSSASLDVEGTIEIFPQYTDGLMDLNGFSHIILIYYFHKINGTKLRVFPYLDKKLRGIFATRAPVRPNPIGISITRLISIDKNIIHVKGIDILNNTPLLDIKPYVPEFDDVNLRKEKIRIGWLSDNIYKLDSTKDDSRFEIND